MALKGGSESEQWKKGRKAREVKLQSPRMWHGVGGGAPALCTPHFCRWSQGPGQAPPPDSPRVTRWE